MMVMLVILLVLICLTVGVSAEPTSTDTLLFRNVDGDLCQMVHVKGVEKSSGDWKVEVNGKSSTLPADEVKQFKGGWLVPVPAVDERTSMKITNGPTTITHMTHPQKRWTAYLTSHTHFDIGFTDVQPKIWSQVAADLVDVLDMCDRTDSFPEDSKYRWTIECSALFEDFEKRYPDQMPRLLKRIKEGRIEVAGAYLNLLTELCSGEELCRSLYPIDRIRDKYGIDINTAMHNDIPGITWQSAQLFSQAGIKYLAFRANAIRGKFVWSRQEAVTRPFLWEGPDGSSIMVWYTDSYREANFFRADCPDDAVSSWMNSQEAQPYDHLLGLIGAQERKGTTVDAVQMRMGGDNLDPTINTSLWAKEWNEQWAYPHIVVSTNRMFFDHIEKFRDQLQTHRGDIPDWWADGAGSSARETGMNRLSHDRTAVAESILALTGSQPVNAWDTYVDMLLYDEHTWGSDWRARTEAPEKAAEQWKIKSSYAFDADRKSHELMDKAKSHLTESVRRNDSTRLLVWNPLPWVRSEVVELELPEGHCVYDSGRQLPMQRAGERWAIQVNNIPAIGWKCFDIKLGNPAENAVKSNHTQFPISYIYETGAKRENVIPIKNVPQYERVRDKRAFELTSTETGPLFTTTTYSIADPPGAKSAELKIRSCHKSGDVKVEFNIDKIATEEVENVYLEFPFDLKNPAVHASIPLGWMNPASDRLPCTCGDFYSIDNAVDINDGTIGVTWAALEAPLIQFAKITTGNWSDAFSAENGAIYSWIMNNEWFTNYCFSQGGPHTFRYAYKHYSGPFDPAAASRFGEETARPLEAILVTPGQPGQWANNNSWSAFTIEPGKVLLESVKQAEDGRGIILRLVETAGKRTEVTLTAKDFGFSGACLCSLLEKDVTELNVKNGKVESQIGPWEVLTLRLVK